MNAARTQFDWLFGVQWLVVCAVGLLFGGMFALAAMWSVSAHVERAAGETAAYLTGGALFGAIFGLSTNLGPGLLLQGRGLPGARWALASILGGAIGAAIGIAFFFNFLEPNSLPEAVIGAVIGIFLGLPIGLGQWFALRQQNLLAGEWVPVSSLAFVVGLVVGLPLGGEGREWLSLGITGLLVGAITGLGAVWVLRGRVEPAA
jgi:hypothetical protein